MLRFRPGLWPTIAALVLVIATASLGRWQFNRADYKARLQAQSATARSQPPLELRSARDIGPEMRYRQVTADGTFDASRQIWLDNRTYKGTAG
jgi:surfeit locus 1 family protein